MKTFIFMMLALVQNITQAWSDDAWTLRNQLLARSPYLSEEVITKAILQDILPQAMILEICLANPDVLRNGRFIEFLKTEISNPLPQYMIDILYAYQGTTSPRSVLENGLASYSYLMLSTGNELIRNILNDSLGVNTDSLHTWLGRIPTLSARYNLAESYFETGQNELAWQVVNDIPTEYALHSLDAVEYANYLNYLNLRIAVKNSNRTISQLSNEELATLQSIRDASESVSGILANNLLCFHYNICKDYPAILPEIGNTQPRLAKPNLTTLLNDLQNEVEVHPNPVKEYAIFAYSLQNDNAQIVITDVTGKIIQRLNAYKARGEIVWDTHNIANGIYFYSVVIGDKSVATGKITVNN